MRPGIYALASLEGAPLDPVDLHLLGFDTPHRGLAVRVEDIQPGAIHRTTAANTLTLLAGFLDEPEQLAAMLGLPSATPPITLAAEALERFGPDASYHMLGEWTLLRWHGPSRELTILTSQSLRDSLCFAFSGTFVAIGPSALQLGSLPWVGRALDPENFPLTMARAGLRHMVTDQTLWRGIRKFMPATREIFTAAGRCTTPMSPPPLPAWHGTFHDAVHQLDLVGRRIVRQHMERHGCCAFQLSGGLDSSLMTSWGALERGPGREMFAVTSIAPPGSGLVDEQEFSVPTAEMLGVQLHKAWPPSDGDLFRPDAGHFALAEAPVIGPYLVSDALTALSLDHGATAVISGAAGEMHLSNGFELPETRSALRIWAAGLRDRRRTRLARGGWPAAAFHIRLSEERLRTLPAHWADLWRQGPPPYPVHTGPNATIGISPMHAKMATVGSDTRDGRLRHLGPYRDQRLQRLADTMPAHFLRHEGQTRPMVRELLKGRVPERVRLRTQGSPYSPDYVPRLRAQAAAARHRIPLYREAGIGEWLDLSWLSRALHRLEQSTGAIGYNLCYAAQGTAALAEFLLWVRSQNIAI